MEGLSEIIDLTTDSDDAKTSEARRPPSVHSSPSSIDRSLFRPLKASKVSSLKSRRTPFSRQILDSHDPSFPFIDDLDLDPGAGHQTNGPTDKQRTPGYKAASRLDKSYRALPVETGGKRKDGIVCGKRLEYLPAVSSIDVSTPSKPFKNASTGGYSILPHFKKPHGLLEQDDQASFIGEASPQSEPRKKRSNPFDITTPAAKRTKRASPFSSTTMSPEDNAGGTSKEFESRDFGAEQGFGGRTPASRSDARKSSGIVVSQEEFDNPARPGQPTEHSRPLSRPAKSSDTTRQLPSLPHSFIDPPSDLTQLTNTLLGVPDVLEKHFAKYSGVFHAMHKEMRTLREGNRVQREEIEDLRADIVRMRQHMNQALKHSATQTNKMKQTVKNHLFK